MLVNTHVPSSFLPRSKKVAWLSVKALRYIVAHMSCDSKYLLPLTFMAYYIHYYFVDLQAHPIDLGEFRVTNFTKIVEFFDSLFDESNI